MEFCPYCAHPLEKTDVRCSSCGAGIEQTWVLPNQTRLGKYRLERFLGQGGFGITYLALDTHLNRQVAIKELFPEGCSRQQNAVRSAPSLGIQGFAETKARFLAEAQSLAQFSHVGIVRVFDVFEANNTAYLVMEALHGQTLGQRLVNGKLPAQEVQRLGLRMCEALEVVHAAGLLHRDLKPDNVFLTTDNRVILLDFGSARAFASGAVQQHTRLVTPGYAAPEQYASQAQFAAYTDMYGLAATLYHALTGVMPISATDRMLGSSLRVTDNIPLMQAILQGMEIVAAKRPASAKAFAALLEQKAQPSSLAPEPKPSNGSSNPMTRQVVNPVPSARPSLAQVAASMPSTRPTLAQVANTVSSRPSLSTLANQPPIFKPTPLPVPQKKRLPSSQVGDDSGTVAVGRFMLGVAFLVGVYFAEKSQNPQVSAPSAPPQTIADMVRSRAAVVYNSFQSIGTKASLTILNGRKFDCKKNQSAKYLNGYEVIWGISSNEVQSCWVSLEKNNSVRVVVRGSDGSVSVNGK